MKYFICVLMSMAMLSCFDSTEGVKLKELILGRNDCDEILERVGISDADSCSFGVYGDFGMEELNQISIYYKLGDTVCSVVLHELIAKNFFYIMSRKKTFENDQVVQEYYKMIDAEFGYSYKFDKVTKEMVFDFGEEDFRYLADGGNTREDLEYFNARMERDYSLLVIPD